MTGLETYGPYAVPLAIIAILAQIIWNLVKRRAQNGRDDDTGLFRDDIRLELKEVRRSVHEIRDLLQGIVTKLALVEYRVTKLEERQGHK